MSIQHTDAFFQRLLFLHLLWYVIGCSIPCYSANTHIHTHRRMPTFQEWVEQHQQQREKSVANKRRWAREIQANESITAWMEWNILRSYVSILAAIKITSNLFYLVQIIPFSVSWIEENERCLLTRARVYLLDPVQHSTDSENRNNNRKEQTEID